MSDDDNIITGRFAGPAQYESDKLVLRSIGVGTLLRELRNSLDDIEKFGAVVERIQAEDFVFWALHRLVTELNARSDWIERHIGRGESDSPDAQE